MIYIIDHNDSFTFNVVHQFSKFDEVICDNYDKVNNDIIDEAEDTLTILNTYVDNLEIKNDRVDLQQLLRSLYDEALSISN